MFATYENSFFFLRVCAEGYTGIAPTTWNDPYADVFIDIYGKLPSIAFLRSLSISELAADMCTDRDAVELYQAVQDDAVELYQALHPGPLCYV